MDAAIGRAPPITDAEIQVCSGVRFRVCAVACLPPYFKLKNSCSGRQPVP